MTKDRRLYARFDIGMDEHPKIMLLSDAGFRALFESTLYSRRQLTDGFIAERVALKKWGPDVIPELTGNDPERPSWRPFSKDGVPGFLIHDFAEHQTTTADIEAKREAGRKGGLQKASNRVAGATEMPEQNGSNTLAKTETETETKPSSSTKKSVGASRRKPEVPMPDDWTPKPSHVAYAVERGVDGRHEEGQFRAWVASKDARYRDWDAAFRGWLGRATPQKLAPTARAQRTVMLATDLLEVEA